VPKNKQAKGNSTMLAKSTVPRLKPERAASMLVLFCCQQLGASVLALQEFSAHPL
jgi:hypothetical protein